MRQPNRMREMGSQTIPGSRQAAAQASTSSEWHESESVGHLKPEDENSE